MFTVDSTKLQRLLIEHGINIADLAERAKISKDNLYCLLRCDRKAQNKTVGNIARVLNVPFQSFVKEDI